MTKFLKVYVLSLVKFVKYLHKGHPQILLSDVALYFLEQDDNDESKAFEAPKQTVPRKSFSKM